MNKKQSAISSQQLQCIFVIDEDDELDSCPTCDSTLMTFDGVHSMCAPCAARVLAAQAARIEALTEALARVEWGGVDNFGNHCPICANYQRLGHDDNCELAALLAATPGAVPVVGAGTRAVSGEKGG